MKVGNIIRVAIVVIAVLGSAKCSLCWTEFRVYNRHFCVRVSVYIQLICLALICFPYSLLAFFFSFNNETNISNAVGIPFNKYLTKVSEFILVYLLFCCFNKICMYFKVIIIFERAEARKVGTLSWNYWSFICKQLESSPYFVYSGE